MIIELVKLAVADASNVADVAIMSVVQEGGEGATRQVFTSEPVEAVIEDGQRFVDVHDFSVSIAGLGTSANHTKLKSFIDAEKEVIVSGYTVDGHVLQGGGYLSYRQGMTEAYRTGIIELRTRGQYGYDADGNTSSGLMLFRNMLAAYNLNSGVSSVLYGFDAASGIDEALSGGTQSLERATDTTYLLSKPIYFPFSGKTITASVNITVDSGEPKLRVGYLDASLSALSPTGSTTSDELIGTGIKSLQGTTPSGTVYVKFGITPGDTLADAISFNRPSMRIDGSTTFTLS